MNEIVLQFLAELKDNNNRNWFQANDSYYRKALKEYESFVNALIPAIREFDSLIGTVSAKDCLFRIYRDVRFSRDKSPYKTNFGAYIARGGRKSMMAGYYVHAEPGGSFLAGGLYMPPADVLKKVREEIYYNVDDFKKILHNREFKKYFPELDDPQKLVKAPKGFPSDWPDIDLLKLKSYAVINYVDDELVVSDAYLEYARNAFRQLSRLNDFFNKILI